MMRNGLDHVDVSMECGTLGHVEHNTSVPVTPAQVNTSKGGTQMNLLANPDCTEFD